MNETPRSDRSLLYFIILMAFYWVILIPMFSADNSDVKELDSQEWRQAVEERAFVLDSEQEGNDPAVEHGNQRMPNPLPGPRGEFQQTAQDKGSAAGVSEGKAGQLSSSRTRTRPSPGCWNEMADGCRSSSTPTPSTTT